MGNGFRSNLMIIICWEKITTGFHNSWFPQFTIFDLGSLTALSVFLHFSSQFAAAFARLSKKGLANNARLPSSANVTSGWLNGIGFFLRTPFHSQTKPPWPWPPGGQSWPWWSPVPILREDPDVFLQVFGRHYIIPTVSGFLPDSRYPDVLFCKKLSANCCC